MDYTRNPLIHQKTSMLRTEEYLPIPQGVRMYFNEFVETRHDKSSKYVDANLRKCLQHIAHLKMKTKDNSAMRVI